MKKFGRDTALKREGHWFDSPLFLWKFFFIDLILPAAQKVSGVDLASNRNDCQEYFLGGKGGWCVGADNLTTFMC